MVPLSVRDFSSALGKGIGKMKLWKQTLLLAALLPAAGTASWAQVDKVAVRTTGISCGDCALISEIYLRELKYVDKVTISRSQEAVLIIYKPGTSFQPWDIRDALAKTDVGVAQFQISAQGRVQEEKGKAFLMAGKDKFLLVSSPKIPPNSPVSVEGIVNDRADPMELKILVFKPLKQ
jgi:hypothetical protein